ncbi:hypothetical protein D3C81_1196200 [compost metagenome]
METLSKAFIVFVWLSQDCFWINIGVMEMILTESDFELIWLAISAAEKKLWMP